MSQYPEYYYTYSPQQYQVQQVQGVVGDGSPGSLGFFVS
jgi:hypothetical protein